MAPSNRLVVVVLACLCLLGLARAVPLTVVLFPYIPDAGGDNFIGLKQELTERFRKQRDDVELTIRMDSKVDVYNIGELTTLLGNSKDSAHVLEVDALLLSDLVTAGLVPPVPEVYGSPIPSAAAAVLVDGQPYGVPTYICSNVVYSYADITKVGNAGALVTALKAANPDKPALTGNLAGSWTLPGSYIDAWADTHTNDVGAVAKAIVGDLDKDTVTAFQKVVNACDRGDKNPCLNGGFTTTPEVEFATRAANGFVGYSERLFYVKKQTSDTPFVISAPLGAGKKPVMFVDALVFNKNMDEATKGAAHDFAKFLASPEIRELLSLSLDVPQDKRTYRYLMQASSAFWDLEKVKSDPVFNVLREEVAAKAVALPNAGFPTNRKRLQAKLQQALGQGEQEL